MEQFCVRVFLEAAAGQTQFPPRPTRLRDEILSGFLCGMYRPRSSRCATHPRVSDRSNCDRSATCTVFSTACPTRVTKFRKGFCAECITRRISRSLHNSAGAVLRRRRCAAARTQRKFFRLKFVRYAHRQTAGHRHSRAFVSCLQRSVLLRTAGLAIPVQLCARFVSASPALL